MMTTIASTTLRGAIVLFLFASFSTMANAQEATPSPSPSASPDNADLQLEADNPFAKLLRLPFQDNLNFNDGDNRLMQQQIKFQPLVPTQLGDGHLLVTRVVMPFENTPPLGKGSSEEFGFGDFNPQFYYVAQQGPVLFGYGPTFLLPTATSPGLGSGKWGIGPDVGITVQRPHVLYYILVNNIWSFAGVASRAPYNQGSYQPSASWSLAHGFSIGVQSSTTVNWNAPGDKRWTVPLGPTWSQLLPFDEGNVQLGGAFFWNVVHPVDGSTWTARFAVTFLYAKPQ